MIRSSKVALCSSLWHYIRCPYTDTVGRASHDIVCSVDLKGVTIEQALRDLHSQDLTNKIWLLIQHAEPSEYRMLITYFKSVHYRHQEVPRGIMISNEDIDWLPNLTRRGTRVFFRTPHGGIEEERLDYYAEDYHAEDYHAEPNLTPASPTGDERPILVTGAKGGIGQSLVNSLKSVTGCPRVIEIGRTQRDEPNYFAVDVSDEKSFEDFLHQFPAGFSKVYHVAGVFEDKTDLTDSMDRILQNMMVKRSALYTMHRCLPVSTKLILFSSIWQEIGGNSLSYGMGNACLFGFAEECAKLQERNVVAVAWGTWGQGGMMERVASGLRSYMHTRLGVRLFSHECGLQALRVLEGGLPSKAVMFCPLTNDVDSCYPGFEDLEKVVYSTKPHRMTLDWYTHLEDICLEAGAADAGWSHNIHGRFVRQVVHTCPWIEDWIEMTNNPRELRGLMEGRLPQRPGFVAPQQNARASVVGYACRLPGGVSDLDSLWQAIRDGKNHKSINPGYDLPGCFLAEDSFRFDPDFFGVNNIEAAAMDPQQKIMLVLVHECLQRSGKPLSHYRQHKTGTYIGASNHDFLVSQARNGKDFQSAYSLTGLHAGCLAGRVNHVFDFTGPTIVVDTACSASLAAFHYALSDLRQGVCEYALVGGVNLIADNGFVKRMSRAGVLNSTGQSHTFEQGAKGFGRGEGAGVVLLSLHEGERSYAYLRGTSVNHDSRSPTIMTPSLLAQRENIQRTLQTTGCDAAEVTYFECHGTGTQVGDPIEVSAIHSVLPSCTLGSVKRNIGHLEPAAGIASFLKMLACYKHGQLPACNVESVNPSLRTLESTQPNPIILPWAEPRKAMINSFSITGLNANLLMEPPPEPSLRNTMQAPLVMVPLVLSAHSLASLRNMALRVLVFPGSKTALAAAMLATTSGEKHTVMIEDPENHAALRYVAEVTDEGQLTSGLPSQVTYWRADKSASPPKLCFLYTGQGSQRQGLGDYFRSFSQVFRDAAEECEERFSLSMSEATASANVQPCIWSFEYSLCRLLEQLGVRADVHLGHSFGEYVVAFENGALGFGQATRLVEIRNEIYGRLPPGLGTLKAIASDVYDRVRHQDGVYLACDNSDSQKVIGGSLTSLANIRGTELKVDGPFHTPLMASVASELQQRVAQLRFSAHKQPTLSNLTGDWAPKDCFDENYFARTAQSTVQFRKCLSNAPKDCMFLEVGPKPHLWNLVRQSLANPKGGFLGSQRGFFQTLVKLRFVHGVHVDFARLFPGYFAKPLYPLVQSVAVEQPPKCDGQQTEPTRTPSHNAVVDLETVLREFMADISVQDEAVSLSEIGFDSLMCVELEHRLEVSEPILPWTSIQRLRAMVGQENVQADAKTTAGSPDTLYIIGSGGHLGSVLDIATQVHSGPIRLATNLAQHIGRQVGNHVVELLVDQVPAQSLCHLALGDYRLKEQLMQSLVDPAWKSLVHPTAHVGAGVTLGQGVFLGPYAIIDAFASVGDHAIVSAGSAVGHNCTVGEHALIGGNACMAGGSHLGRNSVLSVCASLAPKVRVSDNCIVGPSCGVRGYMRASTTVVNNTLQQIK